MATYKELFFSKYANARGNIRKGVKAIDVWNSIEEFIRIIMMQIEEKQRQEEFMKTIPKSIKWTRKGNCPACGVKTGSNHKKGCMFKKEKNETSNIK